MNANYADIGGCPAFYPNLSVPDVQNKFSQTLDYKGKSRSASRDRFSDSNARKIDQDLRSTAIAESVSAKEFSHKRADIEAFLQSCKIKKAILKEKLSSAELRLQDLVRDRKLYRLTDPLEKQARKPDPVIRATTDEDKLKQLKQDRAVQNHNLNVMRQKIERLRVVEGQLLRQTHDLDKNHRELNGRLSRYETLVRENMALKSKLQKASMVLNA